MLERLFHRPIIFIFGAVLLVIAGLSSVRQLPVDLFPDLNYPLINVITHAPAGTAEDIEQLITRPIENAMLGLTNLQRVRSVSAPGFSQVTIEFRWGVDVMQARQMVASHLSQVTNSLPPGTQPQIENIGTSLAIVSTYSITSGASGDAESLRGWVQYNLAPRLEALPGITRVEVMGGGRDSFRIDLNPDQLVLHQVSPAQVVDAIGREHVLDTGGFINRYGRELLIRTDGLIRDLDSLKNIVIKRGEDGRPVLLDNVATVYRGPLPQRYRVTSDRKAAVVFSIQKQAGASTVEVSKKVDQLLAQTTFPDHAKLRKFYDQAEIIGLAYRNMRNNLLIGAILAVLTLVWVLGHNRATWMLAVTLPLAVLGAFALLHLLGMGLNLMTLSAMTVSIGMITDDSVIVLENIDRHRATGKSPMQATIDGLREIFPPDLAGTLTVMSAFIPLLLITGLPGRLFLPFGLTFTIMLILSFIFSIALIPVACANWLHKIPKDKQTKEALGTRTIATLQHANDHILSLLLKHRTITFITAIIIFAASTSALIFNPVRFIPLLDENSLLVSYQLAPGTSLSESNRFGDELESKLLQLNPIESVIRRTGSPENTFFLEGPDQGELVVRLRDDNTIPADQIRAQLQTILNNYPGVISRVNEPTSEKIDESFSGLPGLFGITVLSNDLKTLYDAANKIESAAKKIPGIANVVNNTKVPFDQIVVHINRTACATLGVSANEIARSVRIAMQGESAGVSIVNQKPLSFFVRYADNARQSPEAVKRLLVQTNDGRSIPLARLADVIQEHGYPMIEHQYGVRSLTMPAGIDGNPLTVIRQLDQTIKSLNLDPSVRVTYTGQYQQMLTIGTQAMWALLAAAFLVYGVVAFQLRNLLDPLVVLIKLPIDFTGAAIALAIMHQPLDITLPLGLITLIGVSVNNGIVLMTFTRKFREEGLDAQQAVRRAVALRFRPMILTHLTTLLALIPAAIGLGHGPQLLQPLGIMLFGGLTAGTLLTLTLLPVVYVATDRWRKPTPQIT